MSVTTVVRVFVHVVILAVPQGFIQLSFKTIIHKFSNCFLEQGLDFFHAGDVAFLQQCPNLLPTSLFFWGACFYAHIGNNSSAKCFITNTLLNTKKAPRKTSEPIISLVRQEGFEPPTHGLEVHPLNYAPIIRSFNPSNIKSSRYSQNPYFP